MTIKDAVDRIKSDLSEVGYSSEKLKYVYKGNERYFVFELNCRPINRVEIEKWTLEWHVILGTFESWWPRKFQIIKRRCQKQ